MKSAARIGLAILFALACTPAIAHPLAPVLLDIDGLSDGRYHIAWRTSVSSVARTAHVEPMFDARCRPASTATTRLENGEALVSRWTLDCGDTRLAGTSVGISGIDRAGINVVLRWRPRSAGENASEHLLDSRRSSVVLPAEPVSRGPLLDYAQLGAHHLAIGADHLLFLAGLMWIVRAWRGRVLALTAFTLGHGVTFALAALDLLRLPPALAETAIAFTLLLLGAEILRRERPGWIGRAPAAAALMFGLVHGLGFAGALRETGLPPADTARALLGFHLGIEAAQIAFVLALAVTAALIKRLPAITLPGAIARHVAAYGIGAIAGYWFLERAMSSWTIT